MAIGDSQNTREHGSDAMKDVLRCTKPRTVQRSQTCRAHICFSWSSTERR